MGDFYCTSKVVRDPIVVTGNEFHPGETVHEVFGLKGKTIYTGRCLRAAEQLRDFFNALSPETAKAMVEGICHGSEIFRALEESIPSYYRKSIKVIGGYCVDFEPNERFG